MLATITTRQHVSTQALRLCALVVFPFCLSLWYAWRWVHGISIDVERPFVYRQFVPLAAWGISQLSGAHINVCVIPVVMLCAVGFAFTCYALHRSESFVLANVSILFLIISDDTKTYDVPTAMFFALALVFFQRRQLLLYELLFPFICLNRETSILLTLLFGVYFFARLERRAWWGHMGYQVVVYVAVRLALMWIFVGAPGSPLWFRPVENLWVYVHDKPATILFLLAVISITYIIRLKWNRAPELARTALLLFAPVLGVLYLVSGVTFEIRVFVELLPVVMTIAMS